MASLGFGTHCKSVLCSLFRDRWLLAAAVFIGSAAAVLPEKFFPLMGLYIGLVPASAVIALGIVAGHAVHASPSAPLPELRSRLSTLQPRLFVTVFISFLVLAAFTSFKVSIPAVSPFYADPYLVALDRWLHGTDPWKIVRVFPEWMTRFVDFTYSQIWFAVALGILLNAAMFDSRAEFRRLVAMSFMIYAGLGIGLATLLSSVGPVFYDKYYADPQFPLLVKDIYQHGYAVTQIAMMDYLRAAASSNVFLVGTGISAMPSVHVAVAVSVAWYLSSRGPLAASIGWAFAGLIMFGSVYTGWHYAVDGYVSFLLVTMLWFGLSAYYKLPSTFLAAADRPALPRASQLASGR